MLTLNKTTKQYSFQIPDCHNKMNQYGKLTLMNKQLTFRSMHRQSINQSHASTKREERKGEETLSMLLLTERSRSEHREVNPELKTSIEKLESMGLNSPKVIRHIRYQGHIKIPTVHNDYHTRATNQGYSRSESGGIFPK